MNREIKFRAWDTESNKYRNMIPFKKGWIDSDAWDDAHEEAALMLYPSSPLWHKDRFIYEQFTGLKDKNDKEIYEGDIVKCRQIWLISIHENPIWSNEVVRFFGGGFCLTGIKTTFEDCEIIGNIHENPELLK